MSLNHYTVRYFDPASAAVVEAQAEASSETEARNLCAGPNGVVLGVQRAARRRGAQRFDVALWCRELRTLLRAGMTIVECVETLHAQSSGERLEVLGDLLQRLRAGQSLSRAMDGAQVFPAVLVASVKASERTSTLVPVLEDYLRYDDLLDRLRQQAVSAAIYPGIVISLGTLITLFLLLYVIPRFSRMYVDFRGSVSLTTEVLLSTSSFLHAQAVPVLCVLGVLAAVLVWLARRGAIGRAVVAAGDAIAPLRRQLDHFRLAKLYQSLAMMFRGGYTLDEALLVCEGLGLGPAMSAGVVTARHELVEGRAVSRAFDTGRLTDTVAQRLLAAGERSGSFDAVLQTIADRHAQSFMTFIERTTRIIEPLLLTLVALAVGGIVVMMYMPIFDIANGMR